MSMAGGMFRMELSTLVIQDLQQMSMAGGM